MTAQPFETLRSDPARAPRAWRHELELAKMLAVAVTVYATLYVLIEWRIG